MPVKKWKNYRRAAPQLTAGDRTRYMSRARLGIDRLFSDNQINRWSAQAKYLRHPTPAGRHDPLSVMLVLDLLMRLEPETEIRGRDVAFLLNDAYDNIYFDSITCGRIMTCLMTVVEEYCPLEPGNRPIEGEADRRGYYYMLVPSVPNWIMLAEMRSRAGSAAEKIIKEENETHRHTPRPDFPWEIFEGLVYRTGGATNVKK